MQSKILKGLSIPLENEFSSMLLTYKGEKFKEIEEEVGHICKSLEVIDVIKFLRTEKVTEHTLLNAKKHIDLEKHRVERFKCFFKITNEEDGSEEETNFHFDIPVFLEDEYFLLYGTRYRPMMQFVNYRPVHNIDTKKYSIVIKTLINKLVLNLRFTKANDLPVEIVLDLFKKKTNLALVLLLLTNKDIHKIMKDFFTDYEEVAAYDRDLLKNNNYLDFKTKMFKVNDEDLMTNPSKFVMLQTLNKLKLNFNSLDGDNDTLIKRFGSLFTTNSNTFKTKGERVLVVISRMLDNITKRYLDSSVENVYDMLVFEIKNLYKEGIDNNNAVETRRLIFTENIFYPLLERLSNNLYIYLNTNYKSFSKLNNIFKIQNDIIVKHITTSELVVFDDSTSSMDTFLREKVSLIPQGLKKQRISNKLRLLDETYLGMLDIITSSNGDSAGLATFITPIKQNKILCENGLFISKD